MRAARCYDFLCSVNVAIWSNLGNRLNQIKAFALVTVEIVYSPLHGFVVFVKAMFGYLRYDVLV